MNVIANKPQIPPYIPNIYKDLLHSIDPDRRLRANKVDPDSQLRASKEYNAYRDFETPHAACWQLYKFFPGHLSSACDFLQRHKHSDVIENILISDNNNICLIDVGCGSGTASAAFLIQLDIICKKLNLLKDGFSVHFIGIDLNPYNQNLYTKLISDIARHTSFNVIIDFVKANLKEDFQKTPSLSDDLTNKLKSLIRNYWNKVHIPRACLQNIR